LCIKRRPHEDDERYSQADFKPKDDKIAEPDMYLSHENDDGRRYYCWSMSPEKYVKSAVTNAEETSQERQTIVRVCHAFVQSLRGWKRRTNVADGVQYYQELIGIPRWQLRLTSIFCWKPRCYRRIRFAS
jgi:hypothetical protein